MEYSVSPTSTLHQLRYLRANLLLFLLLPPTFVIVVGFEALVFSLYSMLGSQILISAPCIALHLRYWSLNRATLLQFNENDDATKITVRGVESAICYSNIVKVIEHRTISDAGDLFWTMPWHHYSYAEIYVRDGTKHIITSLLLPDLKFPENFPQAELKLHRLVCWP